MCRLVYIPDPKRFTKDELVELFKYLEKSAGGDGNGVGGFVNGKPFIHKGLNYTVEDAVNDIFRHDWDIGVLFHTRLTSVGKTTDENNHPFYHDVNYPTIMVHNGTITSTKLQYMRWNMLNDGFTPRKILHMTDSEMVCYHISKHGIDFLRFIDPERSTFLVMFPNAVYEFSKRTLYAAFDKETGEPVIYASEFNSTFEKKYDTKYFDDTFGLLYPKLEVWKGELTKKKTYYFTGKYYYYSDNSKSKKKKKGGGTFVDYWQ